MIGAMVQLFADNLGAFIDAAILLSLLVGAAALDWIRRLG